MPQIVILSNTEYPATLLAEAPNIRYRFEFVVIYFTDDILIVLEAVRWQDERGRAGALFISFAN